jgi:RNA polymerase sigma factor (sigma-70 family)
MGDRPAESASRDIEALFRLGVVGALTDEQLLERFTARADSEGQVAFEAIVRRHGPMVLGVCRRVIGDHQAAEDAFQATFMVLALRAGAVRSRESLGPWLHGVAARIARRAHATGQRFPREPLPAEGMVDVKVPDPALADLNAVIDEELGRLPEKYRLPVVLCYLEGRTQEEAARTLGWTKGTVSGRLARAKDLLRHRLTRRGLAPSAGLIAGALWPETASAAVPSSLLNATVRVATAAILGGAEAGLVAGSVASLVRAAIKWMMVARLVRAAAQFLVLGIAAAAIAAPVLMPGDLPAPGNPAGRPIAKRSPAAAQVSPAPPTPRFDGFGDPLPAGAPIRLGTIQRRHTNGVVGINFARDGRTAVSVQRDGLARFWNTETGRQIATLDLMADVVDPDRSIKSCSLSPDGRHLAAAGFAFDLAPRRVFQAVWIWDLATRRLLRRLEVDTLDLDSVAFSPDGATIATAGFAGDVRLFDVATGARRSAFKMGMYSFHSLAFAPDGKVLAGSEPGRGITLWDLEQGRGTLLADRQSSMFAPCFAPDGRLVAAIRFGQIALRDRTGGQERLTVPGSAVAFAPDSRTMAVTGAGDTLSLIDTGTGAERWRTDIGLGASPVFSPDGKDLAIMSGGVVLRFFDAGTGRERFGIPEAHQAVVTVVRYAPGGRSIFTAGDDGTVREWDALSGRQLRTLPPGGRVSLLAVSPDGRSLATVLQPQRPKASVSVWDLATGQRRREWSWAGELFPADAMAFSSGGESLFIYGRNQGLKVLEVATGRERSPVQPQFRLGKEAEAGFGVNRGDFAAGGQFLAVMTARTAHVADLATGAERFSCPSYAMAFGRDGKTLAVATPGAREVKKLANGQDWTNGWNAEAITLVDVDSGDRRRIAIAPDTVVALALSPNGKVLAVAGGMRRPMIRLYRTSDGRELESFAIPAAVSRWNGLAYSPDGCNLAAGLDDTTVPIWDVRPVD